MVRLMTLKSASPGGAPHAVRPAGPGGGGAAGPGPVLLAVSVAPGEAGGPGRPGAVHRHQWPGIECLYVF